MKDKLIKALPIIAIIISLFTLVLVFAGFTNFNFKIGDFEFGAGKKNNIEFIKAVSTAALLPTICEKEQIATMEDKVNQMIHVIMEHHAKLLKQNGVTENYFSHPQYLAYGYLVEHALNLMKKNSETRFIYMYEHFNEGNIKEFKEYAKNTTIEFINAVAEIIQKGWVQIIITKEQNYEWTRQLVPKISEMIFDVFECAYETQIKYQHKIKELENTYNKY